MKKFLLSLVLLVAFVLSALPNTAAADEVSDAIKAALQQGNPKPAGSGKKRTGGGGGGGGFKVTEEQWNETQKLLKELQADKKAEAISAAEVAAKKVVDDAMTPIIVILIISNIILLTALILAIVLPVRNSTRIKLLAANTKAELNKVIGGAANGAPPRARATG